MQFRSLENIPNIVFPDTNVLLNAAYVAHSRAPQGLNILRARGFQIALSKEIIDEAFNIINKYSSELGLGSQPRVILDDFLRELNATIFSNGEMQEIEGINRSDRHVAAIAKQQGGWVLTSDYPLSYELEKISIPSRSLTDVVLDHEQYSGTLHRLENVIDVHGLSLDGGSIFSRIRPAMQGDGKAYVCDIEKTGSLYFDQVNQKWCFDLIGVSALRLPIRDLTNDDAFWVVCGSYRRSPIGGLTIRLMAKKGNNPHVSITGKSPAHIQKPGRISFGGSLDGSGYINGHLLRLVIGARPMSVDTFSVYAGLPGACPNPWDNDVLKESLKRLGSPSFSLW